MGVTVSTSHVVSAAPSQREDSSHSAPAPAWGPSHRRQFSTNFSNVSPSHGLQLFTNELPQRGSLPRCAVLQEQAAPAWVPTGSQVLPATCSSVDSSLSSRVHRSWQEPAPARGSPWNHSFLQASTCSGVGSLPRATGGDLIHRGPPWAAGEQPTSPWSSSQVAREGSLLRHLRHLLPPPSFFTDLGVCRVVSLT